MSSTTPDTATSTAPDYSRAQRLALIVGAAGLGAFVVFGIINMMSTDEKAKHEGMRQFFASWTVGFMFWIGISFGSLALRFIHHLVGTSWGLLLRPMFYAGSKTLPLGALLFIPVGINMFMGDNSSYWWANTQEAPSAEALAAGSEQNKEARDYLERQGKINDYLNPGFALPRSIVYFAIWFGMGLILNKWVMADRNGDAVAHEKLKNWSGPLLMLWAVVGTFAATDWIMSYEVSWSSTMFPVIFGVTQLLTALTFSAVVLWFLVDKAPLSGAVRLKHKIDIGSFTLALTMVWSYTSFSQFLLIWVGNLPEEVGFFLKRLSGGWEWTSIALAFLFFALPFLLLLFRDIKKHPHRLRLVQIHVLCMAALNVLWWIDPAVMNRSSTFLHFPMDVAALVGIGGIWVWWFLNQMKTYGPLLTAHEMYMVEGEHHRSHVAAHGHEHAHDGASHSHAH